MKKEQDPSLRRVDDVFRVLKARKDRSDCWVLIFRMEPMLSGNIKIGGFKERWPISDFDDASGIVARITKKYGGRRWDLRFTVPESRGSGTQHYYKSVRVQIDETPLDALMPLDAPPSQFGPLDDFMRSFEGRRVETPLAAAAPLVRVPDEGHYAFARILLSRLEHLEVELARARERMAEFEIVALRRAEEERTRSAMALDALRVSYEARITKLMRSHRG